MTETSSAPPNATADALELADGEAKEAMGYYAVWSDALANRTLGLFGVISIVATLVPALAQLHAVGIWRAV